MEKKPQRKKPAKKSAQHSRKTIQDILKGKLVEGPGVDPSLQAEIALSLKQHASREIFNTAVLNRDISILDSVIAEYLKCFIIIGYDINGEKISITHAKNAQEFDSVVEHARGTLMQMVMRAQQNLPGMPPM